MSWLEWGLRKYDRLSLTVIFLYGRVVQSRESLSDLPFDSANQNKNICAAQQSSELQVTIMDYNQTFRRSFKLSEQKIFEFVSKSMHN